VPLLRSVAERLSRRVVLRRRLPPELGRGLLYTTPEAGLRFWRRDLRAVDPLLLAWAAELVRPGDVVWDLGANVGLFSLAAGHRATATGAVVAVEADDWLTSLLHRSVAAAPPGTAPVTVLTAAVAAQVGIQEFAIAKRSRAGNFLAAVGGSTQAGGVRESRRVLSVTADWLLELLPAPQVVKIDVEGAESACLAGAERLLAEVRPTILCEVTAPNAAAVETILRRHEYHWFDASLPKVERVPCEHAAWNTLAIPAGGSPPRRAGSR